MIVAVQKDNCLRRGLTKRLLRPLAGKVLKYHARKQRESWWHIQSPPKVMEQQGHLGLKYKDVHETKVQNFRFYVLVFTPTCLKLLGT